ncbi:MAG: hypothetical protein D3908_06245, partial [Candidatus Electrothrix sp. AUS4]|nr:hypothetical protein [Candidatus Electrothrix sp. AUS4]
MYREPHITEKIRGIVQRITYHNPDNGWSVLRVNPFDAQGETVTVTVHQTQVFAGATMDRDRNGLTLGIKG